MTSNKRWDDWLDDERISKTGVFSVHRNYIGGNGQYLYSRYQRSKDRSMNPSHNQGDKVEPIYIGDTSPIATGITAYFVCDYLNLRCLKYYLENQQVYKTEIFYLRYLNYCIQPELNKNNMLPNPDTSENIVKRFIPNHIKEERLKLKKSKEYFEQCKDANDEKVNSKLREYVNGYFLWVDSHGANPEMIANEESIHSLLKFSRDDANKKTIDSVLKKCKDNLNGINFDLMSYAALYLVIYTKYKNYFKPSASFTDVQKAFNIYFKIESKYKLGKAKQKAEELKNKYRWIDTL